ncbi:hypothetical protein SNOG_02675 [Parastagonospora nodorum SN15]|uniref:histidine kinase n=1 Tax=Phaeosphaeria nodorum (strain SN15 / ATCC MYA-4574 / FGSC 10173) TaxID=321614 RepID=Q0UZY9_PHANO|nr:hypothetical protein SNOG_02675 [Parastagonospora nodorum SN15]EAT89406.2 hypothetical protein SNOG_02675 [Parastagonospora nodorum SN15]
MTQTPKPSSTTPRDPIDTAASSTPRPPLQRVAASNAFYSSQTSIASSHDAEPLTDQDDETSATESTDMSEDDQAAHGRGGAATADRQDASPDEMEVERLRALQLQMLQKQQQRARQRGLPSGIVPSVAGARRPSPIKEEPMATMSPTLEGAFNSPSPLPTAQTTSTESTESARTIRGSVPPTPSGHALRTPSYPFPTVPGTPRWASTFHQPFTNLSPTVSAIHARDFMAPSERIASETSTPAASMTPFAPGPRTHHITEAEDPRYPSPNLYDLVLRLNAEPGLPAWWTTVTAIMREHYGANRATLAVPADASDIENVPWGQKTTYTATAEDGSPRAAMYQDLSQHIRKGSVEQTLGFQPGDAPDMPPTPFIPERRPKLFSRHSFAGHERQKQQASPESPTPSMLSRPHGPLRASPAPSPAIQNDPEDNPFFSTGKLDEETFNPSRTPQDYTQYGAVEAIGVDRASTVTHVPLVHPTLSQAMHPNDANTPSQTPSMSRRQSSQSIPSSSQLSDDHIRRAPIAILSILSAIVPYPRNLTNSLKHLGPHLATSFSNAWQFTNTQMQVASIRQRQTTGSTAGSISLGADQHSLDDLLHLNLENISTSAAGSVTSPSDYSGRSRHSPGGSIAGTPGWDASSLGFSNKHSFSSTPGHITGSEAVESYFDARKKTSRAPAPTSATAQEQYSQKSEKRHSKRVTVNPIAEKSEDDVLTPRNDMTAKEEGSAQQPRQPTGPSDRGHSLLHSYGADFTSSFQSLPAATTPGGRPPPTPGHVRRGSITETFDMPPPSESLLRTIIDSLPVQIFTAAPSTGAITWVNSKFLIYRGQDSRQVLQDPWDSIHPEDRSSYLEQWNKSLRTGQQLQQKVRLQRFDQCYRWFYVRVAPLRNKRQQIVHWIGTNMDFHEQHTAELNSAKQQETAASEAKYRALANSSPQIVFVVSNKRGMTFCNSQWITFSGQSESQALVSGFLEHVHPDDVIKCKLPELSEDGAVNVPTSMPPEHGRTGSSSSSSDGSSETERTVTSPIGQSPDRMDMPQAKLSKLASTGILRVTKDAHGRSSYSTEVRLRNKDGEYRWHLVRILLEKSLAEDSEEETWYGTATDINDHKLLEQTLKETMDAKSKFLSNMSHEIRTPLNGISGMVNFLLDSILNAEQLEHVNIIKSSTDSLLNLINDILDLSKVEAGMIKLSMEWLHLPSLIEEVNDLSMGLAIQKGLELNYLVDEGVPSMVKGDKFRIRQVLLNVVGNAIKFTSSGEIFVRCKVQSPERSGPLGDNETVVRFEVIDTGRGFTEQEAKFLFKRFSQIDASSTRQHGGTGLGLAISMQFVELHGGKMDARSVPNKGSTFFFTIKFGLPTEEDHPPPAVSTPGTPAMEPVKVIAPVTPLTVQPSPLQRIVHPQVAATAQLSSISLVWQFRPLFDQCGTHWEVKSALREIVSFFVLPAVKFYLGIQYQSRTPTKTVAGQASIIEAQKMIGGDNPVLFTHVVLVLHDTAEVHAIMDQVFSSINYGNTSVVVVSDPSQKKELIKEAPVYDYEQLHIDRRLQFIYRPLKPSKFAVIFDPQKERESSTDRNQDSAQQVVVSQKLVFEELKRRVGGKGHKVLLVEDNKINQTVVLKFLAKIDVETETVMDGVQCTDTVFAKPPGHYSIILCDLHMPNKDGYQACKEIRKWEKKHGYRRTPIIALSANVLGDVYAKCAEAGFNSYVTKPVEFKQLSIVMTKFLDPADPSKPPEFMKSKK